VAFKPIKIDKNWGYELWIHNDSQYCGKLLVFPNEGNRFSMHYHMIKNETWYVQKGAFLKYQLNTLMMIVTEFTEMRQTI